MKLKWILDDNVCILRHEKRRHLLLRDGMWVVRKQGVECLVDASTPHQTLDAAKVELLLQVALLT